MPRYSSDSESDSDDSRYRDGRSNRRERRRSYSRSRSDSRSRSKDRKRTKTSSTSSGKVSSTSIRDRKEDKASSVNNTREEKLAPVLDKGFVPGVNLLAAVTENNGEISCSVEETNRIRAALGLKPLNLESKKTKEQLAVDNFKAQRKHEQIEIEKAALREKLEKAKSKRLLHAKLAGSTLGEISEKDGGEEALLSAADWVKRSRKKELSAAEKAKRDAELAAKRLQEQEEEELKNENSKYSSSDLRGLQVMHGDSSFETGREVILTLADSDILETDERGRVLGLRDEADVLINVNMADEEKRIEREKRAKRAKMPAYSAYDDEEFGEDGLPKKRSILSQYDEEKQAGPRMSIGDGGNVTISSEVAEQLGVGENGKSRVPESLRVEKKELSSFYTEQEYSNLVKIKKPSKKSSGESDGKVKKLRKIRKKDNDDQDGSGEADGLNELEASLAMEVTHDTSDHGSRSKATSLSEGSEEVNESQKRRSAYENAVRKAGAKSASIYGAAKAHNGSGHVRDDKVTGFEHEDDDAEIAAALARTRRLALQQQQQLAKESGLKQEGRGSSSARDDAGAEKALQLLRASKEARAANSCSFVSLAESKDAEESGSSADVGEFGKAIDAEGRQADGKLVFTSTTEFTTRLQARLNEKARSLAEAAVRESDSLAAAEDFGDIEESSSSSSSSSTTGLSSNIVGDAFGKGSKAMQRRGGLWASGSEEGMAIDENEESEDTEDEDLEQVDLLLSQPTVKKGLAATLAFLKGTGELQQKTELAGRVKDSREHDPSITDNGIKLEYRDSYGRKLTQKEAYRQLCYSFHGYGPGKKKLEKRQKAMIAANKAGTKDHSAFGTMKSLTQAQEAMGKAHVTIEGGSSSGVSAAELAQQMAKKKAKDKLSKQKKAASSSEK